jgi:FkbM family methyltransferase
MKQLLKSFIGCGVAWVTGAITNGPGWMRAGAAFMLSRIDNRRRIDTGRVRFVAHVGSPLERWRADTLLTKEPETTAWLDRTIAADSVFYDVGANIGMYTLYAAALYPETVRAVCFEPEPMNFARLNQNIAANGLSGRVLAYAIGLGAQRGIATMPLSTLEAGGALHGDDQIDRIAAAHVVGIDVWPLAEVLAAQPDLPPPTHLKIDVDGPELAVLEGARPILGNAALRHALVEVTEATAPEVETTFAAAGFEVAERGAVHDGMFNMIFEKRT